MIAVFLLMALAAVLASVHFLIWPGKGRLPWLRRLYWLACVCLFYLGGYPMYFLAADGIGGGLFGMALMVFLLGMAMTLLGVIAKVVYARVRRRAPAPSRAAPLHRPCGTGRGG